MEVDPAVRLVTRASWLALGLVTAAYVWFSFRADPRLESIPFVPRPLAFFFDLNPLSRNFPAFLLLGLLARTAVSGLGPRRQRIALVLCLAAPAAKDIAQDLFAPTRHFNWDATLLGTFGAAVGWLAAAWLMQRFIGAGRGGGMTAGDAGRGGG